MLIFPKGNNVDYLSMYLDVADSSTLPYGWSRFAQFSLTVVNQVLNKFTIKKGTSFAFYLFILGSSLINLDITVYAGYRLTLLLAL